MPIELKNSVRNSVLYLVTASGKCVRSRRQRPGPGACHGVCVVIVFSASVIVFSFTVRRDYWCARYVDGATLSAHPTHSSALAPRDVNSIRLRSFATIYLIESKHFTCHVTLAQRSAA